MTTKIDIIQEGYATLVVEPRSSSSSGSNNSDGNTSGADNSNLNQNLNKSEKRPKRFMKATGSCCLVHSNQSYLLFDTMGPYEKDTLLKKLEALKVHPDDVEYLVCSHTHPDHSGNLNLFTNAKKHFIGTSVYTKDVYDLNLFEPIGTYVYKSSKVGSVDIVKYQNHDLDTNLCIEPTPGHTMECISLLVKNCDKYGTVALTGDLFEAEQDVEDDSIWLGAGSQNPNYQRANRDRIYNQVDYILPGHGPLFQTLGPLK